MRFLLGQKEALEICCHPISSQKHSKIPYSWGENEKYLEHQMWQLQMI